FIWKYCTEVEDGWKCNVCNESFNYKKTGGSTTNTLKHLEREHGLIRPEISTKFMQNMSDDCGDISVYNNHNVTLSENDNINIQKKLVEFIIENAQPFNL
ncbi:11386_t:CDS:2, partial [Entrophospora sp. SA101]